MHQLSIVLMGSLVLGTICHSAGAASLDECEAVKNRDKRAACFEQLAKSQAKSNKEKEFQRFSNAAKKELTRDFLDPDSANFRDVFITENDTALTLCGEVNARNSVGGYVGYKPFIVSFDKKREAISSTKINSYDQSERQGQLKSQLFELAWEVSCKSFPQVWKE